MHFGKVLLTWLISFYLEVFSSFIYWPWWGFVRFKFLNFCLFFFKMMTFLQLIFNISVGFLSKFLWSLLENYRFRTFLSLPSICFDSIHITSLFFPSFKIFRVIIRIYIDLYHILLLSWQHHLSGSKFFFCNGLWRFS